MHFFGADVRKPLRFGAGVGGSERFGTDCGGSSRIGGKEMVLELRSVGSGIMQVFTFAGFWVF